MTDQEKALKLKELFVPWSDLEEILYQIADVMLEPDMSIHRLIHLLTLNTLTPEEATEISRHLQLFIRFFFSESLWHAEHSDKVCKAAREA